MKPVQHIKIRNKMSVNELVKQMGSAGVLGAGRLGKAVNICQAMIKDKDCKVFLGLAGPLVPQMTGFSDGTSPRPRSTAGSQWFYWIAGRQIRQQLMLLTPE